MLSSRNELAVLIDGKEAGASSLPFPILTVVLRDLLFSNWKLNTVQVADHAGNLMWSCGIFASMEEVPILGYQDGLPIYSIMGGSPIASQPVESWTTIGANTWTNPGAWKTLADVYAGGGGGGQSAGATFSGGGAGGSQFARVNAMLTLTNANGTNNLSVGNFGTVGSTGANAAGGNGSASWFSNTGVAPTTATEGALSIGGRGGGGGSATANGTAGSGTSVGAIGDTTRVGGNGAAGQGTSGGGGGGGSGNNNPGNNAATTNGGATAANNGGAGGQGASATSAAGLASVYGGGGGGGGLTKSASNGAQGLVAIQYTKSMTNVGQLACLQSVKRAAFF